MEEGEKNKKTKEILRHILMIIIILLLLTILFLYISIYKMGRIGYQANSNNLINTIELTQNNINWNKIEDLDIFNNPQFNNEKIVVPMSKGSYEFVISNKVGERVKYNINFSEINELNINMKYRLKLNNIYVIGNENTWIDIENMKLENIMVEVNSSTIYTLEWYWEEANNDTEIGEHIYAEYKCQIDVSSELYT